MLSNFRRKLSDFKDHSSGLWNEKGYRAPLKVNCGIFLFSQNCQKAVPKIISKIVLVDCTKPLVGAEYLSLLFYYFVFLFTFLKLYKYINIYIYIYIYIYCISYMYMFNIYYYKFMYIYIYIYLV